MVTHKHTAYASSVARSGTDADPVLCTHALTGGADEEVVKGQGIVEAAHVVGHNVHNLGKSQTHTHLNSQQLKFWRLQPSWAAASQHASAASERCQRAAAWAHLAGGLVGHGHRVEAQHLGLHCRHRLLPHVKAHAHAVPVGSRRGVLLSIMCTRGCGMAA